MATDPRAEDFIYQCPSFESHPPGLQKDGKRALDVYRKWPLSKAHMATLKPRPRNMIYRTDKFEERIALSAKDYRRETGSELHYAGMVTKGKNGNRKCEAHLLFPANSKVNWRAFKRVFRRRFDLVVTGTYSPDEQVPSKPHLKNRPPHEIVLEYVASHADHVDACWLWEIREKKRRVKRRRRKTKSLPPATPIFATGRESEWLDEELHEQFRAEVRAARKKYRY